MYWPLEEIGSPLQIDSFIYPRGHVDLLMCVYDWLAEHYTDPESSVAYIARHFGVSVRKVHRRFSKAPQEVTFCNSLRTLRMPAAVRILGALRFSVLTTSEIGYHLEFSEPAYFRPGVPG